MLELMRESIVYMTLQTETELQFNYLLAIPFQRVKERSQILYTEKGTESLYKP